MANIAKNSGTNDKKKEIFTEGCSELHTLHQQDRLPIADDAEGLPAVQHCVLLFYKMEAEVLLSGYINDLHTYEPGPDGKFGYGGKCFPKDVDAFAKMTKGTSLGTFLRHLHELNMLFRGMEEHI